MDDGGGRQEYQEEEQADDGGPWMRPHHFGEAVSRITRCAAPCRGWYLSVSVCMHVRDKYNRE